MHALAINKDWSLLPEGPLLAERWVAGSRSMQRLQFMGGGYARRR